ncbi:MAG: hypothetical protein M3Q19_00840 [Pseudomonadota bacterium]|nr:hypothetical protein [Pseudomonadota bacterium]
MADTNSAAAEPDPRFRCFERAQDEEVFETSVASLLGKMQATSRQMFVSQQNILRMNHGGTWVHAAREPEPDTSMHTISAEWMIPFKDIAENDLSLIARTILPINEEMEKQFALNMYGVVGAAAEKVGNVVDVKATGSFAKSMLEMFQRIELGVDRNGAISMPQIHVGPGMAERIAKELESVPPEIEAEIEQVKAEKVQQALEREASRKAKFKRATP